MRNTSLALLGCYSNLLGGDCLSYVGTEGNPGSYSTATEAANTQAARTEGAYGAIGWIKA
jgi:hypothetical protein